MVVRDNYSFKKQTFNLMRDLGFIGGRVLHIGDGYVSNTMADVMMGKESVILNTDKKVALPLIRKEPYVNITGQIDKNGCIDIASIGKSSMRNSENDLIVLSSSIGVPSINLQRIIKLSEDEENFKKIMRLMGTESEEVYCQLMDLIFRVKKEYSENPFESVVQLSPDKTAIKRLSKCTRSTIYLGYNTSYIPEGQYEVLNPNLESREIQDIFDLREVSCMTVESTKVYKIGKKQ